MSGAKPSSDPAAGHQVHCTGCRHSAGAGFAEMSSEHAIAISRIRKGHFRVGAGSLIERTGLAAVTIYSGYGVLVQFSEGDSQASKLLWPGDLVVFSASGDSMSETRIQALTDVTYCGFAASDWAGLSRDPLLAARLLRILSQQISEANALAASIRRLRARERVCMILGDSFLQLRRRRLAQGTTFTLPLSRHALAQLVGLTPTHLRRVLQELAHQGLLSFRRGRVELHSVDEVMSMGQLDPDQPLERLHF
jgi:CRP/FNR family transcriptional regulator, anaerobic regulatory protein